MIITSKSKTYLDKVLSYSWMHKSILILKQIYIAHSNNPNINFNHLITPCKPPACSNTTTHHKTNHRHNKYNAYKYWHQIKYYSSHLINNTHSHLQEMKNTLNIYLLFITSNQQYSFTFVRNEKHSQYVFKPPYNTMQATCLLQHNNPPQN